MFNIWKENGLIKPVITEILAPERVVLVLQVEMGNVGEKFNTTTKSNRAKKV